SISGCCSGHNSDLAAFTPPSRGDRSFRERQIVMSPLVAVQCVTKSYGRGTTAVKALDDVSLEAAMYPAITHTRSWPAAMRLCVAGQLFAWPPPQPSFAFQAGS